MLDRTSIQDFAFDKDGKLWVATSYDDGVIYQRNLEGEWTSYDLGFSFMHRPWWTGLVVDTQARAWVTSGSDIFIIDPSNGQFTSLELNHVWVGNLTVDGQRRVWLTQRGQIKMQDNEDWKIIASKEGINGLVISTQGDVWVRTDQGVSKLGSDGNWKEYPYDEAWDAVVGETKGISLSESNFVVDKRGRVWTGTAFGLWVLDPEIGWKKYEVTRSGLKESGSSLKLNPINCLIIDGDERLWIAVQEKNSAADLIGNIIGVLDVDTIP
jgi:ligand-binding sensor domain-containing protein